MRLELTLVCTSLLIVVSEVIGLNQNETHLYPQEFDAHCWRCSQVCDSDADLMYHSDIIKLERVADELGCNSSLNEQQVSDEDSQSDEGQSRAGPIEDIFPPRWLRPYYKGPNLLEKSGYYVGPITRVTNNLFLADHRVVQYVDGPPEGCLGGWEQLRVDQQLKMFDGDVIVYNRNPKFDPKAARSLTSAERGYLNDHTRLYEFVSLLTQLPKRHRPNNLRLLDGSAVFVGPEDHLSNCLMQTYVPIEPNSHKFKFVQLPIELLEDLGERQQAMRFEHGVNYEYFEYMYGSPVVCNDKLAFITHSLDDQVDKFVGTKMGPWAQYLTDMFTKYYNEFDMQPLQPDEQPVKQARKSLTVANQVPARRGKKPVKKVINRGK